MTATPNSIRSYKIALVQMLVLGGAKEKNISRAEQAIDQAARQGAKLALLPEALDLGWTHPTASSQAEAIPGGAPFLRLCQAAEKHQIFVCAGLTEREGDQVFNAAVLIDDSGRLLLKHRKLNELEIGHATYSQGTHLNVAHTSLGTIMRLPIIRSFLKIN